MPPSFPTRRSSDLLLHGVADEHQGRDLPLPRFLGRALQHLADLGAPGETEHTSHEAQQLSRFGNPRTRPALDEAAVVDELHVKSAKRLGPLENTRLQVDRKRVV